MGSFTVNVGGQEYDVDAPDERTAWKWAKSTHIKTLGQEGAPRNPGMYTPSGEKDYSPTSPQNLAAHPLTRFATGAAAPLMGGVQLAANALGDGKLINEHMRDYAQIEKQGRENLGSTGFDFWKAGGQALSPAYLGAAGAMPNAATTAGRIGQGAALGAAAGAAEPVTDPNYWATKGGQVAGGAMIGAAVPGAWEGGKALARGLRNFSQPFMGEWGASRAAGRLAGNVAGDKADDIIAALRQPQEFVPGSAPTAGQAAVPAGSAEFSALQKIAESRDPSRFEAIAGKQAGARSQAIGNIAGDESTLRTAEALRSSTAAQNYGAAWQQAIKGDPELAQLSQNPFFKKALPDAKRLAQAEGINAKDDLTQFLHFVKLSLDKQKERVGDTALSRTEKHAVDEVSSKLASWISKKNPAYESARATFEAQSKPIEQMKLGQQLQSKLEPALDGSRQRGAGYAEALRKMGAEGDLNVMAPEQINALQMVGGDLSRNARMESLARSGQAEALRRIGAEVPEVPPTGMFNPTISTGRAIINRFTGQATDKILDAYAKVAHDPAQVAKLMQEAKPFERRALVDALMRYQATTPQTMDQGR